MEFEEFKEKVRKLEADNPYLVMGLISEARFHFEDAKKAAKNNSIYDTVLNVFLAASVLTDAKNAFRDLDDFTNFNLYKWDYAFQELDRIDKIWHERSKEIVD
jgi:hypothetical protein